MKSGDSRSKNAAILQAWCASALSCSNTRKSSSPHIHVNAIALHVFVAATVKRQKFVINWPDCSPSEHDSNWQHQLRPAAGLYPWHIMTSTLCHVINCYILLKYFKLIFLRLQLVKVSCKLIIICVNYERKKKGSLFMKHRVFRIFVISGTIRTLRIFASRCVLRERCKKLR